MNLSDYCDAINVDIEITRYSNQKERWTAKFRNCEIKDGGCLISAYGDGSTANDAIRNYISKIAGKVIVKNAASDNRQTFLVPENLEY